MKLRSEYVSAVDAYLRDDLPALHRFIADPERSQLEIALIRARIEIRKGNYERAFDLLPPPTDECPLLRGDAHFLRACLHSHLSRWQSAVLEALTALEAFRACDYERGLFITLYNLSVYYNRLGLDELSQHYLLASRAWIRTPNQQVLFYRAQACEHSRRSEFSSAVAVVELALRASEGLDPVDFAALKSVAADVYFRADRFEAALAQLTDLSQSKIVLDQARVRFDLTVLRSLIEDRERFVPRAVPKFVRENVEYELRWQILESLQSGDLTRAKQQWSRIVDLLPNRYAPNFETLNPSDERTIFITAVRRLRARGPATQRPQLEGKLQGKLKALYETLTRSELYLRKEEIIERIWSTPYDPSLDNRFYKLLERLRREGGVTVEVVLHTYRIVS